MNSPCRKRRPSPQRRADQRDGPARPPPRHLDPAGKRAAVRKILIVGAGQAGLQLALGLQAQGYDTTVMSNRTPDEIRAGRVMSTQCMFATALRHERDLGLNFWEDRTPRIEGLGVSVAGPGAPDGAGRAAARPLIDWVGRLDGAAQSVDRRVKMAGWLETFAERGGKVV